MMKIAIDAGALSASENGIGRYLHGVFEHMLRCEGVRADWLLYGRGAISKTAWPANVQVRVDHMPPHFGRVAALGTSLPHWLARDRPHVFWGPAHRLPLWLPLSVSRVVTIHDLCWLKVPETMRASTRRLDSMLMPRALHSADRIIAVSNSTAEQLRTAFPNVHSKIVVVHEAAGNLPPPRHAESLRSLGIGERFVLFVGTNEPRKNLRRLVQAFIAATRDQPDIQLVVAGQSGWGNNLGTAEYERSELTKRIVWLGKVDDGVLSTLYRHARCLALPSLYEGFGLPLLEALSHGTPVLTSDCSAMPEVAGPAGVLVDPLSTHSITRGLQSLLFDGSLHSELAARAIIQANQFSWDNAARATLEVFAQAVDHRRGSNPTSSP